MRIDQHFSPIVAIRLRAIAVALAVGLFLSACSSPQTLDLIDRRINNVTHVFNLD